MTAFDFLPFTLSPFAASVIAFIGVTGMLGAMAFLLDANKNNSAEERLQNLAGKKGGPSGGASITREALVKEGMSGLTALAGRIVDRFRNIQLLFLQADTTITLEKFILLMVLCGGVLASLTVLAGAHIMMVPLVAIVGSLLPFAWLLFRRARRFKMFAKQLPDALELVARALRSGHSLTAAMKVVVDELPDPISKEFNIAYEEQNLGVPVEQAIKNLYTRMPNMDYKFFTMAVSIQRQSGGDLAEILDKIGHIIRERVRILGQVQALTGEGRISGIVLMALPVGLFFAVWSMNPEYVMVLFTDELGQKMVAAAVVLQIIGALAIKKIVAIKV